MHLSFLTSAFLLRFSFKGFGDALSGIWQNIGDKCSYRLIDILKCGFGDISGEAEFLIRKYVLQVAVPRKSDRCSIWAAAALFPLLGSVQRNIQSLAGLERQTCEGSDLNNLLDAGIAALTLRIGLRFKGAEADQSDIVAGLQGGFHRIGVGMSCACDFFQYLP